MDVARPDLIRKKRKRRILLVVVGVMAIATVTIGLSRLKPALPTVDTPIFTDTVKRGQMVREVRGNGTLVPEEIRWITASSPGRIERILLLPGVAVKADTVLIELSNPALEQAAFEAESQWHAAEAQLEKLKVQLESDKLTQQSLITSLKFDLALAKIEAEADEALLKDGLVPGLVAKRSRSKADELEGRCKLEQTRLDISAKSAGAQIRGQEAGVERPRKQHELKFREVDALKVRAGFDGVLQSLGEDRPSPGGQMQGGQLQSGQQLVAGANIARIANPAKLKAEIKIAETQARDILFDQPAVVDMRTAVIPGHVVRIDPGVQNGTVTVDIKLDGPLPRGARPDLSVDGTITLERLQDVLYVGRPVNGQAGSLVSPFKVIDGGKAALRTPVKLGRFSVSSIEIVEGLQVGDSIILSDMSQWDGHDRLDRK